jgi:hypothetical protein
MPSSHDTDLPDSPPDEVLEQVADAWERAAGFAAEGLDLQVGVGRIGGRVRGRLVLEDQVLMRLKPSQILALACGDPLRVDRRD